MRAQRIISSVLIALCSAGIGVAQEQQKQKGDADLAQQARNPTASLTMFQVLVDQTPTFHNLDDANMTRIVLMPVIPFKLGKTRHIARITLPIVVNGPDFGALVDPGPVVPTTTGNDLAPC